MIYQNRLCPFFNLNNCRWQVGMGLMRVAAVSQKLRCAIKTLYKLCSKYFYA